MPPGPAPEPVTLDRRDGPHGEVVLRHAPRRAPAGAGGERAAGGADGVYEIIANGCFLMDSSDGRSERLMVREALAALPGPDHPRAAWTARPALLIGGLGVGFSLLEAAAEPRWGSITVVERERAVIDWHTGPGEAPLAALSGTALRDPRTEIVQADLPGRIEWLASTAPESVHALCLDIDNGPEWTVTEDNASLYSPAGLERCRAALAPGGVLAVWSAQPSPEFGERLRKAGFSGVRTEEIPVARGAPDVVHFAAKPA